MGVARMQRLYMKKGINVKSLKCVIANEDPLVIWDQSAGVWNNLLANLGFISLDEIKIVDDEGDEVTERYEKRLKGLREKALKKYPEVMSQLQSLYESGPFVLMDKEKLDFLPDEINEILNKLDNQKPNGSLDPFYYILQYAIHKSTNYSIGKFQILDEKRELDRQYEEEKLKELEYFSQKSRVLIDKQKKRKVSESIDVDAQLRLRSTEDLSRDNLNRRKLINLNSLGNFL